MKQSVSAPAAAIVIALVVVGSIVVFSRPRAERAPEEDVYVLPYEPPVDEGELQSLRRGLVPLGAALLMPPLGNDRFNGARVATVAPGSPAQLAGMRPGDLIIQINSLKTPHPYAVVAALQRADAKKPSEIVVVRAGKEQKLVVKALKPLPPDARLGY